MFKKPYYSWLIPYLEATLDDRRRSLLEARLAADPNLAAELESLRRVTGHLDDLSAQALNAPATPDIWPKVRDRIEVKSRRSIFSNAPLVWGGGLAATTVLAVALVMGPLSHNNRSGTAETAMRQTDSDNRSGMPAPGVGQTASHQPVPESQPGAPNQSPPIGTAQPALSDPAARKLQIASRPSAFGPSASFPNEGTSEKNSIPGPNPVAGPSSLAGGVPLPPTSSNHEFDPSQVVVPPASPLPKTGAPKLNIAPMGVMRIQPPPPTTSQTARAIRSADSNPTRPAESRAGRSAAGFAAPTGNAPSPGPVASGSQNMVVAEQSTGQSAFPTPPAPLISQAAAPGNAQRLEAEASKPSGQNKVAAATPPAGSPLFGSGGAPKQIASAKVSPTLTDGPTVSSADSAQAGANSPVSLSAPLSKSVRATAPKDKRRPESVQAPPSANSGGRRAKASEDRDQVRASMAPNPPQVNVAEWASVLEAAMTAPNIGTSGSQDDTDRVLSAARSSGRIPELRRMLALRQAGADLPALRKVGADLPVFRALATVDTFAGHREAALKGWLAITGSSHATGEDWFQLAEAENQAGNHAAAQHAYQKALSSLSQDSPHRPLAQGRLHE